MTKYGSRYWLNGEAKCPQSPLPLYLSESGIHVGSGTYLQSVGNKLYWACLLGIVALPALNAKSQTLNP